MLVKAVLEWQGPAGFDDWIDIAVAPSRIGTKSFDSRYRARSTVAPRAGRRSPTARCGRGSTSRSRSPTRSASRVESVLVAAERLSCAGTSRAFLRSSVAEAACVEACGA